MPSGHGFAAQIVVGHLLVTASGCVRREGGGRLLGLRLEPIAVFLAELQFAALSLACSEWSGARMRLAKLVPSGAHMHYE